MTEMPYIKVYLDLITIVDALDNGQRGRLFTAIMQYANGREVDKLQGMELVAYLNIKNQIDRDRSEYASRADASRENGRKGGRPRKTEEKPNNQGVFDEKPKNPEVFRFLDEKPKNLYKDKDKDKDYSPYNPPTGDDGGGGFFRKIRAMNVPLSTDAYEEVRDFMDQGITDSMLSYAVDLAADQNRLSWAYIRGIVNCWITEGVETLQQAKARKREEPEEDDPFKDVLFVRGDVDPYRL